MAMTPSRARGKTLFYGGAGNDKYRKVRSGSAAVWAAVLGISSMAKRRDTILRRKGDDRLAGGDGDDYSRPVPEMTLFWG